MYINRAVSHFHDTEFDIWVDFEAGWQYRGPVRLYVLIFLFQNFPISLSDFTIELLRSHDCILGEVSGTLFKNQLFMLYGVVVVVVYSRSSNVNSNGKCKFNYIKISCPR